MGAVKSIAKTYSDEAYLLHYIDKNDIEKVEELLSKKPNLIQVKLTLNSKMTPLSRAVFNGNIDLVRLLV